MSQTKAQLLGPVLGTVEYAGDVNFDSGTLFVDSANNRVGVGTDAPSDKLSIRSAPNSLFIGGKDSTRGNHVFQILADDTEGNGELRLYRYSGSGTHEKTIEIASQGSSYFNGGNVGIGTNDPLKKLHILSGTSGYSITNSEDAHIVARFEAEDSRVQIASADVGGNGSSLILSNSDKHWIVDAKAVDSSNRFDIGYYNSSVSTTTDWNQNKSTYFTIETTGNIGINQTNPAAKFDVDGSAIISNSNPGAGGTVLFVSDDGSSTTAGDSSTFRVSNNGGNSAYSVFEAQSGSGLLVFKNDGRLGIGTATPSSSIEIYGGDIRLSNNAVGVNNGTGPNNEIKFVYNGHQYAKIVGNGRDSSGYGDIDFYTSNSDGVTNLTQRMTIRADGKVGIGTEDPTDQVSIWSESPSTVFRGHLTLHSTETSGAADTGAALALFGHDGSNGRTWGAIRGMKENSTVGDLASYMSFYTRASGNNPEEKVRITSDGRVLIGDPTGARGQLQIHRSFTYTDTNYRNNNLLTLENDTNNQPAVQTFIGNYSGSNRYGNIIWMPGSANTNSYFRINANIQDENHLVVRGNGNVGISTNNPQTKLHVYGSENGVAHSNSQNQWIKTNLNTSSNYARFDMNGGGVAVGNGVTENPHHYLISYGIGHASTPEFAMKNNDGPLRFYTGTNGSSTPKLSILTNGNVGIGTDNPAQKLDVGGNVRLGTLSAAGNFTDSGSTGTRHLTIGADNGGDVLLVTHASGYGVGYFGYEAGGDRLIIACDNGGGNNKIDFSVNAGTTTNGTTDNINGIAPAMRIAASGNVGIGTAAPAAKLHVQGAIRTNDLELSNLENPTGGNEVDGTRGHWCIQEGETDLYLINRLTGDKYTFNITKVN